MTLKVKAQDMEDYLKIFERAIAKQAELIGLEKAVAAASQAGLTVNPDGHIVEYSDSPVLILLRLIRIFTAKGNLMAMTQCTELIDKITDLAEQEDTAVTQSTVGSAPVSS